ncbi:hypothetical protein F383_38244 [Gossypium arboreum]|uniref:Uncharacterized protein n=1 Tax=Gossypium arboreum TaxID=29729 RepID=A0A0B0MFC2_GOSAR|nr:hypothetical protein F383_38244 [Gossypium arboreum]
MNHRTEQRCTQFRKPFPNLIMSNTREVNQMKEIEWLLMLSSTM